MRFKKYEESPYRGMYINLARWCNQPNMFKKKSIREWTQLGEEHHSPARYLRHFEEENPDIAKKFFDIKWSDYN